MTGGLDRSYINKLSASFEESLQEERHAEISNGMFIQIKRSRYTLGIKLIYNEQKHGEDDQDKRH